VYKLGVEVYEIQGVPEKMSVTRKAFGFFLYIVHHHLLSSRSAPDIVVLILFATIEICHQTLALIHSLILILLYGYTFDHIQKRV